VRIPLVVGTTLPHSSAAAFGHDACRPKPIEQREALQIARAIDECKAERVDAEDIADDTFPNCIGIPGAVTIWAKCRSPEITADIARGSMAPKVSRWMVSRVTKSVASASVCPYPQSGAWVSIQDSPSSRGETSRN
jgi:hypothetical protein